MSKNSSAHKPLIITHNGKFHADEVCAVATLALFLKGRYRLVRTRDEQKIATGDYVVDVGGVYDPRKKRFDHHQSSFTKTHANGVPYSSFGLVWERYGSRVCGSAEVARRINEKYVMAIDATDNGVEIARSRISGMELPFFWGAIDQHNPTWKEDGSDAARNRAFKKACAFAKEFLARTIKKETDRLLGERRVEAAYKKASDKRLIVLPRYYPSGDVLSAHPEPLYVVYPVDEAKWGVMAIRAEKSTYQLRKPFPRAWRGKREEELERASGVLGAVFCHKTGYFAVARTKKAALLLAEKALKYNAS